MAWGIKRRGLVCRLAFQTDNTITPHEICILGCFWKLSFHTFAACFKRNINCFAVYWEVLRWFILLFIYLSGSSKLRILVTAGLKHLCTLIHCFKSRFENNFGWVQRLDMSNQRSTNKVVVPDLGCQFQARHDPLNSATKISTQNSWSWLKD